MHDHVNWPERYDPKTSPIYALSDIDVRAPSEVILGFEGAVAASRHLEARRAFGKVVVNAA